MQKFTLFFILSFLILIAYSSFFYRVPGPDIQKFKTKKLIRDAKRSPSKPILFLDEPTMKAEFLHLEKNGAASVSSYDNYDKTIFILSGTGTFMLNQKSYTISSNEIFYIKAKDKIAVKEIQSELDAVIVTSLAQSQEDTTRSSLYILSEIEKKRLSGENAWNPFLRTRSLTFGLYMLPKNVGGDSTLTHKIDELNIITRGSGKFWVDEHSMNVEPGDIVFVRNRHGHYFNSLKMDLDILIFWEKKSLQPTP